MQASSVDPDRDDELTSAVIGAAIEVHRELGPGQEELAYEEAFGLSLAERGIPHVRQLPVPLCYKGRNLDCGFRLDALVDRRLPVELKAVESILPIHRAQTLTYLRLCAHALGLLLNFKVPALRLGIRRLVLSNPAPTPDPGALISTGHELIDEVYRSAADVYNFLGPGLLRSAYEECLCHELSTRMVPYIRHLRVPLRFKNHSLACLAKTPLLIGDSLPVCCLSAIRIEPIHISQSLALMRQGGWKTGVVTNFNVNNLSSGFSPLELR